MKKFLWLLPPVCGVVSGLILLFAEYQFGDLYSSALSLAETDAGAFLAFLSFLASVMYLSVVGTVVFSFAEIFATIKDSRHSNADQEAAE